MGAVKVERAIKVEHVGIQLSCHATDSVCGWGPGASAAAGQDY